MYVAYQRYQSAPNEFSLAAGILGAGFGFFATKGASVRSEAQLDQIRGAALIREKEAEAKSVDDLKGLYQRELENLKEIVEREGNHLLLQRLREVHLQDIREKLREVDSIEAELSRIGSAATTTGVREVREVRDRLEQLLAGVRNPEQDDRLIRQLCYSVPLVGNLLYLGYAVWKKVDPSIEDRVHRGLNRLARGGSASNRVVRGITVLVSFVFLIGLMTVAAFVFTRVFSRLGG